MTRVVSPYAVTSNPIAVHSLPAEDNMDRVMAAARLTLAAAYGQAPPLVRERVDKLKWVRER